MSTTTTRKRRLFSGRAVKVGVAGRRTRIGRRLALAAACFLGLGGAAQAAVLTTPVVLVSPSGGTFMSCLVSNVSEHAITVRIEALDFHGATLADSGQITLPAGQSDGQSAYENARCRFTVGSRTAVRAHATVHHAGVGTTSSVEAR